MKSKRCFFIFRREDIILLSKFKIFSNRLIFISGLSVSKFRSGFSFEGYRQLLPVHKRHV